MIKRKIGFGSISLFLVFIGIIFGFTLNDVCYGDKILYFLELNAWSNNNMGIHLTVFYSLLFFVPAFLLALKFKNDFGASIGRIISAIISVFLILSTFGLVL